jgi:hypothetical protein
LFGGRHRGGPGLPRLVKPLDLDDLLRAVARRLPGDPPRGRVGQSGAALLERLTPIKDCSSR